MKKLYIFALCSEDEPDLHTVIASSEEEADKALQADLVKQLTEQGYDPDYIAVTISEMWGEGIVVLEIDLPIDESKHLIGL